MDEPQTDGEQYSLAKKFQIEENIRFIVVSKVSLRFPGRPAYACLQLKYTWTEDKQ